MKLDLDVILTPTQYEEIVSREDEYVAETVVKRLKQKKKQLSWVESHDQLAKRFQSFFGKNGVHFPETGFEAHNSEWRAILIYLKRTGCLVFHREIKKETRYNSSKQKEVIHNLQSNPEKAKKKALDIALDYQTDKMENLV